MKLKVCGMKYQDNMLQVAALQPDYLGFIFYEKSARNFTETNIPNLPDTIKKTAVFVDESLDTVIEKINHYQFQAVQLHGDESPEFCDALKRHFEHHEKSNDVIPQSLNSFRNDKLEIIKAFSVHHDFNFDILKPYETVTDYFLFDTKGKLPGGNGYTFDWSLLNQYSSTKPYFLSGGIGIENIKDILSFLRKQESKYCYALDINSKFEIEPGLKNIELLKYFIEKFKK